MLAAADCFSGVVLQDNILRGVRFNLPRQTPKDGYHLLVHGFILQLYTLIFWCVLASDAARTEFNVRLDTFEYPPHMTPVPFSLGEKLGKRWGFAVYRSLAQIGPYLLRDLVPDDILVLVRKFLTFYYIAFARSLKTKSALTALPLAHDIIDTVQDLWPYDKNRKFNIGRPTLHSLKELARELPDNGSAVLTGTQHEEARHAEPKQDLARTNRRDVAVRLAKLDADRQGKAHVMHGGRWAEDGTFDPLGERRAGRGVLEFADPSNPNLPHPLVLMITDYSRLTSDSSPQTHAQHFLRSGPEGKEVVVRKQLSARQDEQLREMFTQRNQPAAADSKLNVRLATQILVRGELFYLHEDLRVDSGDAAVPFIARIEEICVCEGREDIPFMSVRWLRRNGLKDNVLDREILVADPQPEPVTFVFPDMVIGRAGAFHYCQFSGINKCGIVDVRICRVHETVDCTICPAKCGDLKHVFRHSARNRELLLDPDYGHREV